MNFEEQSSIRAARIPREPEPDRPNIKKSDGTPWHYTELRKAIGSDFIETQGDHGYKIVCVSDHNHTQSSYVYWFRNNDESYGYEYECGQCRRNFGVSKDDQFESFREWLSERELVDGRWRRHQNPFDHAASLAQLEFVEDDEGHPIFYRGGIHFVYGKPGTLKSWLALWTLKSADVRLWDFENGIAGTLGRLQALGVTREHAGGYTVPNSVQEIKDRVAEYKVTKPEILCIDGFSGFADVMGINPESNADTMRAFTEVFYPLKRAGVTVVVLDHLPKDSSNNDYPIGAQAKKAQSDVAFLVKHTSKPNQVDLFVAKDRHGELLERCEEGSFPRRYGSLQLCFANDVASLEIKPSYQATINGDATTASDVILMQSIYDFVEENPDSSKSDIERNVLGKTERKRKALEALKDGGYLVVRNIGTSHLHQIGSEFTPNWTPLGA